MKEIVSFKKLKKCSVGKCQNVVMWWSEDLRMEAPSQLPLYNRYEVLDVEGQSVEDVDGSLSTPEMSSRSERLTPCIMTTSTRKNRQVLVVGDSLLKSVACLGSGLKMW